MRKLFLIILAIAALIGTLALSLMNAGGSSDLYATLSRPI
jgi:hypothetical protein